MKTPRFWGVLETLGLKTACEKDFLDCLGTIEYGVVRRFIACVESRDGEGVTVDTYPCDRCGRRHTVVDAGDGSFTAFLEAADGDDEGEVNCPDITGLDLDGVRKRRVDVAKLAACLANALTLKAEFRQRGTGLFMVGTTHERRVPVYLSLKGDDAGHIRDANAVKADTARPLVLLTLTPRECVAARFGRDGAVTFALADVISFEKDGVMKAVASAERLIGQGLPSTLALPVKGPPLNMKGRRFEIAGDFSAITRLRPRRKAYDITNHACREALRVLVECGAGSVNKALLKKEWCPIVERRMKPDGPWPKEHKPNAYFRVRRGDALVYVPFWDAIGTDKRGLYWLKL